jgi:uncharacterized phiE125 gp8 family phage protein
MKTKIATKPAVPAVTLASIKAHLRIDADDTDHDTRLTPYLESAVEIAENETGRALISQTWDLIFDSWAELGTTLFPLGNLQSVTSLKYFNSDGDEQTIETADYDVAGIDTDDGHIIYSESPALRDFDPITVQIVCGFGNADTDVPPSVQSAIKLMVEEMETGVDVQKTVDRLLNSNRLYTL